jgi:hypothetical protein
MFFLFEIGRYLIDVPIPATKSKPAGFGMNYRPLLRNISSSVRKLLVGLVNKEIFNGLWKLRKFSHNFYFDN